jgi:hypothetical protein
VGIAGRGLSDQIEITGSATVGSRQEAEMTFLIRPLRRCVSIGSRNVTAIAGSYGGHVETSALGGRFVTAGDGNMVTVDHMGHPRQAPEWSHENNRRRIEYGVQEERP